MASSAARRSRQPTTAAAAGEGPQFTLDVTNLREVIGAVKEFSPALATSLRRNLRASGEEIIAEQRSILDGPLPGNTAKSGTRLRLVAASDGRRAYVRRVNTFADVATKRSRSSGMRARIKASLKTRVVAGASRQGVNVRAEVRTGGLMAIQWQARRFRHPVFYTGGDTKTWTDQKGQPYFWAPVVAGREQAQRKIADAIDQALHEITP